MTYDLENIEHFLRHKYLLEASPEDVLLDKMFSMKIISNFEDKTIIIMNHCKSMNERVSNWIFKGETFNDVYKKIYIRLQITMPRTPADMNEPTECMVCGSDDINAEPTDSDFGWIWRKVSCDSCGHRWVENFMFHSIEGDESS